MNVTLLTGTGVPPVRLIHPINDPPPYPRLHVTHHADPPTPHTPHTPDVVQESNAAAIRLSSAWPAHHFSLGQVIIMVVML